MLLKVKALHLLAGRPIAILHEETARYLNLHVGERVKIKRYGKKREIVAPVNLTGGETILKRDEIALSQEIIHELSLKSREIIEISPSLKPLSVEYIHKKLDGQTLTFTEIYSIISDVVNNKLTEAEVAFFVSSVYLQGMNFDEVASMTKSMVKTGHQVKFEKPIVIDKHSIGGVEGNRTTPLVVSIIASAIDQLKLKAVMPKTSSRAITSAAGTADVIETITKVNFSIKDIKNIVKKTNACLVWGGSLGLAPADDKIIQIERILSLDPEAQLLASILSKKLSVNATHVLIDISYGKGAKMKNRIEAERLKHKFEQIAKKINLNILVTLTSGSEPVGNGIGANLEIRDVLSVLQQEENRPIDLENRSLFLATKLLSFVTGMSEKETKIITKGILISGEAYKKFEDIVKAQGGSLANIENKVRLGKFKQDIKSKKEGTLKEISNRNLARIARLAGSPADRGSGIYLHKHLNDKIKRNQTLFTIYAETRAKLNHAKTIAERVFPIIIE